MQQEPTLRFTHRVDHYVRFRPRYPHEVADILERECALSPSSVIADVGSGTGIFSELLLERGWTVIGVEPNDAMRAAAERLLAPHVDERGTRPRFRSVAGTAEATGLAGASVDLVAAAQAFHWFDPVRSRVECHRILRPGGFAALVWNDRKTDATPFLAAYEDLLLRRGTDYAKVRHRNIGDDVFRTFYGPGGFRLVEVSNAQSLDWEGLLGRNLSSSYVPAEGAPGHEEMTRELREVFERHQEGGLVTIEYTTKVYLGRPGEGGRE